MPQVRKDDVEQRIRRAALELFAERGYAAASVAEIAERAGVSAGNVYRYFPGKERLFDVVIDDGLVRRFRRLLRRLVRALEPSAPGAFAEADDAPWRRASEELMAFVVAHRRAVVVMLGRAGGSRLEGLRQDTVRELVSLALVHARGRRARAEPNRTERFVLQRIHEGYVDGWVAILATYAEPRLLREAAGAYATYHLRGLAAFFERGR